jgi:hypothetical protein
MARRPFKIVNNLDLAGNKLIDVSEIYRGDYDAPKNRNLLIRAGNDLAGGTPELGGTLTLRSGTGTSSGNVEIYLGATSAGIFLNGANTQLTLSTSNADLTLSTGTAATKITSTVDSSSSTTGALQVAGGVYIAKDLVLGGGDIVATGVTTWNLLNTVATTINFGSGATAAINIGSSDSAAVINLNTVLEASSSTVAGVRLNSGIAVAKNAHIGGTLNVTGNTFLTADLTISGGDLISGAIASAFNLLTTQTAALNIGTSATPITIGSNSNAAVVTFQSTKPATAVGAAGVVIAGGASIAENLYVGANILATGDITLSGGDLVATTAITNVVNTTATTVNAFGAATALLLGATTGYTRINNPLVEIGPSSGTTTLRTTSGSTQIDLFNTVATIANVLGDAATITIGALTGTTTIRTPIIQIGSTGNTATLRSVTGATQADVFNTVATTVNAFGVATTINIAHTGTPVAGTAKFFNLSTFGATVLGDANSDLITLNGTLASATGIRIYDINSTSFRYQITPGDIDADCTLTLPNVAGTLTRGARADGRIDMVNIMNGNSTTALVPSDGGILYSDANGFQVLAASPIAGRVLVAGGTGAAPYWSAGAFTVALDQSFTVSLGAITLTNGTSGAASTLTIPTGPLSFPQGIVAGDIIYANGNGTFARLAGPGATGSVLVSGVSGPTWNASLPITDLTLSGDIAVNGGDITSTSTTFNFLTSNVTTLNMMAAASSTLNIGGSTDNSTTRTVNIRAAMNIGTTTNPRTVNHYGTFNFGGPTGYRVEWNGTDNSMDFIKN